MNTLQSAARSVAITASDKRRHLAVHFFLYFSVLALLIVSLTGRTFANDLQTVFAQHDPNSTLKVDNSIWNKLLKTYITKGENDLNIIDYKSFKENGREDLAAYLQILENTDVTKLNRDEQFAFWANLYNAKTIDVVLDHYPVSTILDIDISPGLFSNGPWGKKVVTINGIELSLDDVEHEIMRKLWKEPRVHYAVNCASIGCPNLRKEAFTGDILDVQLTEGATAFVNSPRGVRIENDRIIVSKIYRWFRVDFGSSEENILKHIRKYAKPELKNTLVGRTDIYDFEYDWNINDKTPPRS